MSLRKKAKSNLKKAFLTLRKKILPYTWWEITIFIVGIASFLSMIVILFLPLGKGPKKFTYSGKVPEVSRPEFAPMISSALGLPLRRGSEIISLNNGDEFLASLLKDIDNATSTINIMVYIWKDGAMSKQILEHLNVKLSEGVEVRIMYDSFGSHTFVPKNMFKEFKDKGGKVSAFHSLTLTPWNFLRNNQRNHRRAIIIDGNIGYTGGMAVSDSWLGNAENSKEYRDVMFRVQGSMASDLEGIFSELWSGNTGEILIGNKFFPVESQTEQAKQNSSSYISLASTPSLDTLILERFLLLSLQGGEHSIYMTTPYFLPDDPISEILFQKAKAGVDVRLLVPNKYNDSSGVRHASQKSYQDLLESGVKIYEYQPTFIHTKTIVIDGVWSIIGSANMDKRSRLINEENVFGIYDLAFGTQIQKIFLDDVVKSKEITLADWKNRGWWQRIEEFFALKFVEQY
jgi:cardiolipin synthase